MTRNAKPRVYDSKIPLDLNYNGMSNRNPELVNLDLDSRYGLHYAFFEIT